MGEKRGTKKGENTQTSHNTERDTHPLHLHMHTCQE